MSSRLFYSLWKLSVYLLPIFILGCNVGSSSSSSPSTNQGQLQLSGRDSQMALGGTHEYIVSLVGSQNLPAPVSVQINSSNSSVLSIESNTCATQVLPNDFNLNSSCSFYVRGKAIGHSILSVASANYPLLQESVTVAKQWGTFSSEIQNKYGNVVGMSMLSFGGDKVYTYDGDGHVLSTTGDGWQIVGGESITANGFNTFMSISSDESHVCVAVEKDTTDFFIDKIRCSANNGTWSNLPDFEENFSILNVSLYKGNIYVLGTTLLPITLHVKSCSINNCKNWQQIGESFVSTRGCNVTALFESTAYTSEDSGIYYQTSSGDWQFYGAYSPSDYCYMSANESGVAIFPASIVLPPYEQSIYFNGSSNIGGVFESIGGGVTIESNVPTGGYGLAVTNSGIFFAPGDGNVYVSNNDDNVWSRWSRVGINNPLLANVYYHDNKLYSLDLQDSKSQIYIYPLGNN